MSEIDQITTDIEAAKARFEANVAALAEQLPPAEEVLADAKKYGAIVGGGLAVVGVGGLVLKKRGEAKAKRKELEAAADVLAKRFDQVLPVQVNVPEAKGSPIPMLALLASIGALALGAVQMMQAKKTAD